MHEHFICSRYKCLWMQKPIRRRWIVFSVWNCTFFVEKNLCSFFHFLIHHQHSQLCTSVICNFRLEFMQMCRWIKVETCTMYLNRQNWLGIYCLKWCRLFFLSCSRLLNKIQMRTPSNWVIDINYFSLSPNHKFHCVWFFGACICYAHSLHKI